MRLRFLAVPWVTRLLYRWFPTRVIHLTAVTMRPVRVVVLTGHITDGKHLYFAGSVVRIGEGVWQTSLGGAWVLVL